MKRTLIVAIAIASLVAGCSGGGSFQPAVTAPNPQSTAAGMAQAALSILVPRKKTGSAVKRPAYVSPDTKSLSFQVPSMGSPQVVGLALGGPACPLVGDNYVCTAYFNAPVGLGQALTIKTFASADGSGSPLSLNTASLDVKVGQVNPITVSLNGVVASLGLFMSPNYVNSGTSSTVTATFEAFDAAGDLIVGTGTPVNASNVAVTPSLATSDTSGAIAIGAYDSSSASWAVSYTGAAIASPTMTVSASGYTGYAAALTVYTPGQTPTPTPSPSPTPTGGATPASGPTPFPTPAATPNLTLSCNSSTQRCGVQRWHTKTLDDVDEFKVNWTPVLDTVTQLTQLPVPTGFNENGPGGTDNGRFAPNETQVFTVRALLITRKHETGSSGDDDYHIEIADPDNPSATMVTEAPHGECTYACASGFGSYFDGIRTELDNCFGAASSSFQAFPAGVIVNFTGVGFFDGLHGQTGALANPGSPASNFELHPLVYMEFVSGKPVGVPGC